jgi:hypothetical protein
VVEENCFNFIIGENDPAAVLQHISRIVHDSIDGRMRTQKFLINGLSGLAKVQPAAKPPVAPMQSETDSRKRPHNAITGSSVFG